MPSGDSAAAAVELVFVAVSLQMPFLILVLPIVMVARVYNQCHWLGDTVAGAILGIIWAVVAVNLFA